MIPALYLDNPNVDFPESSIKLTIAGGAIRATLYGRPALIFPKLKNGDDDSLMIIPDEVLHEYLETFYPMPSHG
jgi:hypothetical protein